MSKNDETIIPDNAQDEFDPDEATPARAQVKMAEEVYVAIKIICAKKRIMMRDFYADAFSELVKRREAWDTSAGAFPYLSPPKDGKLVSIAVFEQHFEEIDRIAKEDGMYHRAAYYTAIIEHVDRLGKEMTL